MNSDYNWSEKSEKSLAESLFSLVKNLRTEQGFRQDENFKHLKLYGNLEAYSLKNYGFYRAEPAGSVVNRITLNIVQSMVDTAVSKLTKNKPRPLFLTDGGDWHDQRKAQKLTQFTDGQFYATDYYAKRALAIQDSAIFGTGALKIYRSEKSIKIERVFIDELTIDENEAIYGEIRSLYQTKYIAVDVLKKMFPDHADKIEFAASPEVSDWSSGVKKVKTPMLQVVEGWRLPSTADSDDGKHAIVVDGVTLFEESYNKSYFPFEFWRWGVRPLGFWGQGIAEQLTGLQLEINKILRTIQVSMHLVSVPKIFVEASSKVVESHLNNKIGGIIKYVGQPPIEGKLGTIPPDLFNHLDRLYNRAYEVVGISQLAAQATKPQGLNSGKALREFNDIESERFMSVAQRDEAATVSVAKKLIDLAKEINDEYGSYEIKTVGARHMETLKWEDVRLDDDKYVMQCFPVSALSKSPAGRLQDVQELMAAGLIGKEDGMKLLDFPDLKQFYNFNNAGLENIERTIERIIDKGDYTTPEPYQNLQLGIVKMQQAYLMYKDSNAPEDRLELFRRWIEDAQTLLTKAQQQVAQQQAALQQQQAIMDANADVSAAPEPGMPVPDLSQIPAS